jgi:hypothetical protein
MENWIAVGIWIVVGGFVGLVMRVLVALPGEQPGHAPILVLFGAFGAVIGGMLGVGLFHFHHPSGLSLGGMAGAVALSALLTWTYRWGVKGLT